MNPLAQVAFNGSQPPIFTPLWCFAKLYEFRQIVWVSPKGILGFAKLYAAGFIPVTATLSGFPTDDSEMAARMVIYLVYPLDFIARLCRQ